MNLFLYSGLHWVDYTKTAPRVAHPAYDKTRPLSRRVRALSFFAQYPWLVSIIILPSVAAGSISLACINHHFAVRCGRVNIPGLYL